ncbi:MAG TPA: PASTA domain-containing protein [Acidobacteria bacterium]|nr:PASTA domain-containing protein [Acidobacteriota bacterium]
MSGTRPEHDPTAQRASASRAGGSRARRSGQWLLRLLLAGCVLLSVGGVLALSTWLTLSYSVRRPEVTLPDLSGVDGLVAEQRLRGLGLEPEISGRRFDAQQPAGNVLDQFPPPGSRTKPGRPVRLILSLGPERSEVPDLTGSSLRRAQLALRAADLRLESTASAYHPTIPLGRVIAQSPQAGSAGYPGDGVSLLVSAGPPPASVVMPSLTGWSVAAARRRLQRAGIERINGVRGEREAAASERVTDQDPAPGTRLDPSARVTLIAGPVILAGGESR